MSILRISLGTSGVFSLAGIPDPKAILGIAVMTFMIVWVSWLFGEYILSPFSTWINADTKKKELARSEDKG